MSSVEDDFGAVNRHFWLTRSMARTLGINLSRAVASGRLSSDDYAEMVAKCSASNCAHRCALWLACQTTTPDTAPDFCVHSERFKRLQR